MILWKILNDSMTKTAIGQCLAKVYTYLQGFDTVVLSTGDIPV